MTLGLEMTFDQQRNMSQLDDLISHQEECGKSPLQQYKIIENCQKKRVIYFKDFNFFLVNEGLKQFLHVYSRNYKILH